MKKKIGKINQQRSFFFEDYTESEIVPNDKNSTSVKISSNRIIFLFFVFFSLMLIFSIKIIYLSLSSDKIFFSKKNSFDMLYLTLRNNTKLSFQNFKFYKEILKEKNEILRKIKND